MVVILGSVVAYIVGTHMPAAAILAPFFATYFSGGLLVPYTALLFLSIMLGYLLSPLHLCLVLTTQYFGVGYSETVKRMFLPLLAMFIAMIVQLAFFL